MLLISIDQMLSSNYSEMIPLQCDSCQQHFQRTQKQVKSDYKLKSQLKHYCSNNCQAKLLKKELVNLTCANCGINFSTTQSDFKKRSKKNNKLCCSRLCANKINIYRSEESKQKISSTLKYKYESGVLIHHRAVKNKPPSICIFCSKEFISKKNRKTCSPECYKNLLPSIGKKAGLASASRPFNKRNRSSNEKIFFSKIQSLFPDSLPNQRIFNNWDADIVIPSLKLAIHWNGPWHYKPILGQELLNKVQYKDELRYKAIEEKGYTNYIIQDMGKMNLQKVEEEYNKFITYIKQQFNK